MSIHALFVMRSGFISGLCTQDDKSSVFSCYDMCHLAGIFKGQFRTAPASWEDEAPLAPRSSARIAASKAPNGVARGEGCPPPQWGGV